MEWLEMVREIGLIIGSCIGEENIGVEVVNDYICEVNSEYYKIFIKFFVLVEKLKVFENIKN